MKILETLENALTGRERESIFSSDWGGPSGSSRSHDLEEYEKLADKIYAATKIDAGTTSRPSEFIVDFFGGAETKTGLRINEDTALTYTTVLKCAIILAETVASLPLILYRRRSQGGKERATDHPLYRRLHDQVNPLMTSFEWRETMQLHVSLWGNGYSETERDGGGRPVNLWPLRPDRMTIEANGMKLRYFYTVPDGQVVELPAENVFHVKGFSKNGYVGMSRIALAREAVALGLSYEEFGARFFSNDATPNGFLKHPGKLSDLAIKHLKESWEDKHKGLSNKHRYEILEEGMGFEKLGLPLEDAQFLDGRKFQERDIAGIFRIPLYLLSDDAKTASYASVEQFAIQFVVHTMRPWFVRWEQALNRDLLFEREKPELFFELLVDALLRGDTKSRSESLAIQRQWGIINADDWNEIENRNPLPNGQGQIYIVPVNYQPLDKMGQEPAAQPAGTAQSRANGKAAVHPHEFPPSDAEKEKTNGGSHE